MNQRSKRVSVIEAKSKPETEPKTERGKTLLVMLALVVVLLFVVVLFLNTPTGQAFLMKYFVAKP